MDAKELEKLIRIGEGYTMEFKTSPSHLAKEICAFANAAGGRILMGVDDQGRKKIGSPSLSCARPPMRPLRGRDKTATKLLPQKWSGLRE